MTFVPPSGLLLVDKPSGITSHDVVAQIRRWMGFKGVGHAGTLDPLATGLMIILVGKGTKISDFILNGDKSYDVRVQLGLQTDTDDITGEVLDKQSVNFSFEQLSSAALKLQGDLELQVPSYSAIKQKGKKLYKMAREKKDFTPPTRKMSFRQVKVLGGESHWLEAHLDCSKGTYIRSWAKALGQEFGVGAVVETLRRTDSSPYSVENSRELGEITAQPFDPLILKSFETQGLSLIHI